MYHNLKVKFPFLLLIIFTISYNLYSQPQKCDCGKWANSSITFTWNDVTQHKDRLACGGKPYAISLVCTGTAISGNFGPYVCIPKECLPQYTWEVTGPISAKNPGFPSAVASNAFSFVPTTPGIYTMTITAICGGKKCVTCKVEFDVKKVSQCCACGKWTNSNIGIKWSDGKLHEGKIPCGGRPFVIEALCTGSSVECMAAYTCDPRTCSPKYDWKVTGPANFQGSSPITFKPTLAGVYTVTITPICGDKKCEPCIIKIDIKKLIQCKN